MSGLLSTKLQQLFFIAFFVIYQHENRLHISFNPLSRSLKRIPSQWLTQKISRGGDISFQPAIIWRHWEGAGWNGIQLHNSQCWWSHLLCGDLCIDPFSSEWLLCGQQLFAKSTMHAHKF